MRRILILLAAVALMLVALTPAASAAKPTKQSSDVYELSPGPPPVGVVDGASATATRRADSASVNIKTYVEPGDALTVWVVAFDNADDDCSETPISVEGEPIDGTVCGADVPTDVFYFAGHVAGGNGKVNFGGQIGTTNHPTGEVDDLTLLAGDGVLEDVEGSEFHMVVRTHGEKLPAYMPDQIHYFGGGCTGATDGGLGGLPIGPNDCADIQVAFFGPAT